jgi:hypothetical protein
MNFIFERRRIKTDESFYIGAWDVAWGVVLASARAAA